MAHSDPGVNQPRPCFGHYPLPCVQHTGTTEWVLYAAEAPGYCVRMLRLANGPRHTGGGHWPYAVLSPAGR
jgi:hypothetical protein